VRVFHKGALGQETMRFRRLHVGAVFLIFCREIVAKGYPFFPVLRVQFPQFLFEPIPFLSVMGGAGSGDGLAPRKQMNIFDYVIQIFPKAFFLMVAPGAGDFMVKRFLAPLSTVVFLFLMIFGL